MAITVGSVEVDVVPNTKGIYSKLKAALVPEATKAGVDAGNAAGKSFGPAMQSSVGSVGASVGEQIGKEIAARISASVRDGLKDGIDQGGKESKAPATKQGDDTGGAFARAMKARLESAFRSLPKIKVDADTTQADKDLAELRTQMQALGKKNIGVDLDATQADAELAALEEKLRALGGQSANIAVKADTAAALKQIEALRAEIAAVTAKPVEVKVDADGLFGQKLRAAALAAQASLPDIELHADSSDVDREIAAVRAELGQLSNVRVGIDADTGEAVAHLDALKARLVELGAKSADVAVRVDAAAAVAELAAVRADVDSLDGKTAKIDVDTSGAMAAVAQLGIAIAALSGISAVPVLAAGVGILGASATAAGVGFGALAAVAIPAVTGIKAALTAQQAAQEAASQATTRGGQAAVQASQKALQMAGAQASLASAERNAAVSISNAESQVTQARQQAAQGAQSAALAVQQAEQSLASAQQSAKTAQLELTQARLDATRQLQDMNNQLIDSQLSQREATLQVQQAQTQLHAIQSSPTASVAQREQAQLTYDQAVQHLKEQQLTTQRLTSDTAKANKAGVDGSKTVMSAQATLAQAKLELVDKTQALQRAEQAEAQQAVAGAQAVAKAEQGVVQARAQAADSIASAQRQVQAAQLSAAPTANAATTAQQKYTAALAKLSPAALTLMDAFTRLKTAFTSWSTALQPQVLPLFTRGLNMLAALLPYLTPLVHAAAIAVTELEDRLSREVRAPFWQHFTADLTTQVIPAITGFGVTFGNVIKGVAGLVDAFLPNIRSVSDVMVQASAKFATWATGLKGSPAFTTFMSYVKENAPILAHFIGQILQTVLAIGTATAPLSQTVYAVLGPLLSGVQWLATHMPGVIQLAWGLYAAFNAAKIAMALIPAIQAAIATGTLLIATATDGWAAAAEAADAAVLANPIVAAITAIVAAITLVVLGIIYAYNHFAWFRAAVQDVWWGIKTTIVAVWTGVLKPVFDAIWIALQFIGRIAMWLWTNAIQPAFSFIWAAAKILFAILVVAVLTPIYLAFKLVAAVAVWLWTNAISPVFHFIADLAVWLWNYAIKPNFDLMMAGLRFLGGVFTWLWRNVVSPTWQALGADISWVWNNVIRPVFDFFKPALDAIGNAFDSAVRFIGQMWSHLKDVLREPVQFVIDTVYNNGIRKIWNDVASVVDIKEQLPLVKFATGGVLPGYTPGRDVHLAALSGGEAVMRPEWTRAMGPGYVNSMNAAARQGGVSGVQRAMGLPGYKDGGIINWLDSAAHSVGSSVATASDWLTNPGKLWDKATSGVKSLIGGVGHSQWAQLIAAVPTKILSSLKGLFLGSGGGGKSVGGVIPTGQHQVIISQALAAAGVPPPGTMAQWLAGMNTLIGRESGWNASAINLWDSNAKAGHPSQGLTQTIPSTWSAYVPASLRSKGILDPVGNVAASIRYIVSQYGSIANVQQANANLSPKGYDSGGYLQPGFNLAYNGTGRPEPVFTTSQANALARSASTTQAAGGGEFTGNLYLDSGEFLGHVRGEVQHSMGALATALHSNRKG